MELYKKLEEYAQSDFYPFHMPGHKRNEFLNMKSPFYYDVTEIDGFDDLHDADDILARGMQRTAALFHTKQSYYLVNGSTCGLLAAVFASTKQGDTLLMSRNCHKSVYNAVTLRNLKAEYLYPLMTGEFNIAGSICVEDVRKALTKNSEITAVIITSPSYDGIVSDVESIAEVVHSFGKVLIVDEAHGAHLRFGTFFPKSAIDNGADLVIHSVHKTLPSLTQTALLHRVSERVCKSEVEKYLSIFQSSSPSYILMSSIEQCVEFLENSKSQFEWLEQQLAQFYGKTKELSAIKIFYPCRSESVYGWDMSKILICANSPAISGMWIYEQLLKKYHIQCEMVSKDYVVCLSSVCDTKTGFERLYDAVQKINKDAESMNSDTEKQYMYNQRYLIPNEQVILPGEVEKYEIKSVPYQTSVGSVSAEYIYLYPPGIPILVPGERISEELIRQTMELQKAGLTIKGMKDHTTKTIEVVQYE